ncbi:MULTISPECIES: DUF309 domain-containing protein [Thermocrispum]|jgi:hypothetical protein|uniref:DUF309 domain-containing protein n=1 Tax=Thermocrispum agreste TaxID=37925 RepID=A0ABD6FJ09_9PSEU|nr:MULTISPECIES: DUF309 domain-containing protein [Thermocrispum]
MTSIGTASAGSSGELPDRDRDESGRPHNRRPRDGLGRPLPYGAAGVPRQPEGVARTPSETLDEAQRLLDEGKPFHAHEVFEDAWKAGDGLPGGREPLWQALAQLAVGLTHVGRGNPKGSVRLLRRGAANLQPYAGQRPYGVDVDGLRTWAQALADQVQAGRMPNSVASCSPRLRAC